ncbi:MAG: zinc-finger domain-containing protein [Gammaproteobacteria bacterium]
MTEDKIKHSKQNQDSLVYIQSKDLPLSCPMPEMSLWSAHPRVFLALDESGKAQCPYCNTEYILH